MALAYLMKKWTEKYDSKLYAVIIDHKLRKESTVEANQVVKNLQEIGWEKKKKKLKKKKKKIKKFKEYLILIFWKLIGWEETLKQKSKKKQESIDTNSFKIFQKRINPNIL